MVGIGIGIAPVRALLEETRFVPGQATVVLRASSPEELYLREEVEALCRIKGAQLHVLPGHRGHREDGSTSWLPQYCADLTLAQLAPQVHHADLFVCGPQQAADLVVAEALAAGTSPDRIHQERFVW